MPKQYLGDAVYVDFDGYQLVLTTEDGEGITNRIVLETDVYSALSAYVEALAVTRHTTEDEKADA